MKVLFAVNNDNISTQIVKKYQKDYKEIISYKNMYYFDAITKELQRDKSYDRIVISEDLEPFANNNYDAIDKFLFEKLDNISDEATGLNGEDIPIILISTDRRAKSEPILVKLFGIGIYNALLGQDRSKDNVCRLLNKPRSKKEAKVYYKIESDEVNYKSENEENVSETEIKNILNHYRRLGNNEDRYIESFNNIAAQYNDAQLRIITKFLPLNVKAVLEEKSPKYQSVMTFGDTASTINNMKTKKEEGLKIGFLKNGTNTRPNKPVIVPTAIKKVATKKVVGEKKTINNIAGVNNIQPNISKPIVEAETKVFKEVKPIINDEVKPIEVPENIEENEQTIVEAPRRGRGRPRKIVQEEQEKPQTPKRGRGRPRKVIQEEKEEIKESILPGFEDDEETDNLLPGFDMQEEKIVNSLPGLEEDSKEEESILPGFDEVEKINDNTLPDLDDDDDDDIITSNYNATENEDNLLPGFDIPQFEEESNNNSSETEYNNGLQNIDNNESARGIYSPDQINNLLSKDKKIVAFVGTTKNGTSFLVNNVAKCLSTMGIKTAILDLTKNRNSYYIYTKNEEQLRNIAYESIRKLSNGITNGINVDRNLDVYTALPGDNVPINDVDGIITSLIKTYSIVLIDCDFNTPAEYFDVAQEIYVVQTMDILTIQPMTAFLRDLKAKDVLKPEKIRVVINKELKVRGLTAKAIIGGLAFYNDPAMSFMTELFNKENVKYCTIPFEDDVYARYLEGVMDCEININGYSKIFSSKLKELSNMVYPLISNKYRPMGNYSSNNQFSTSMNNTLEEMKRKY